MVAFTAQRMGYVGTCLIGVCSARHGAPKGNSKKELDEALNGTQKGLLKVGLSYSNTPTPTRPLLTTLKKQKQLQDPKTKPLGVDLVLSL